MADASFGTPSINPFGLSPTGGYSRPVFVDIDADGDLDAFVGLGNGTTQFLRNAGSAREPAFTIEGSNFGIASIGTFASPTFGDLDGDGDLDAVVGAQSGQTQLFLNTGTAAAPAFGTATTLVPSMASATTPLLIDIDGDSDLDLFVGSSSGTVRFFRNTGTPVAATFSDEGNPFLIPAVTNYPALGAADVDEDGDMDLFLGSVAGDVQFLRNVGTRHQPAFELSGSTLGLANVGASSHPAFADIDGDGDADALFGARDGLIHFARNTAAGIQITESGGGTAVTEDGPADTYVLQLREAPTDEVIVTLDAGSGQVQLDRTSLSFTANNWNVPQTVSITARDDSIGEGLQTAVIQIRTASVDARYNNLALTPRLVDVTDNDLTTVGPLFVERNALQIGLTTNLQNGDIALAFGDLNGDGLLDALRGDGSGTLQGFRNIGSATAPSFTDNDFALGIGDVGTESAPALGDLDADGDLDLLIGAADGTITLYRNNGTPFAPVFDLVGAGQWGLIDVGNVSRPTLVDIDADGDLDAYVGEISGATIFFRNNGDAREPLFEPVFGASGFRFDNEPSWSKPSFADIDGDGDFDAFVGSQPGTVAFYRNNGTPTAANFGTAEAAPGITDVGTMSNIAMVDVDGDGDMDALIGDHDGFTHYFQNHAPGVTLVQTGATTAVTEGGATDSYTLVLRTAPSASVTISLDTTNHQVGTSAPSVTFTTANWNVPQTLTVHAVNDTTGEGTHWGVIGHSVASSDPGYNGLSAATVQVRITDNDIPVSALGLAAPVSETFGLTGTTGTTSPVFGDLDTDGDLDALVGDNTGAIRYLRNDGTPTAPAFTGVATDIGLVNLATYASPDLVDIDGDGDLDAFIATYSGATSFFRNTGGTSEPVFENLGVAFGIPAVGISAKVSFADIDGDGDSDLALGSGFSGVQLLRNTGSRTFANFSAIPGGLGVAASGNYTDPELADIDGDGDIDLLVSDESGLTKLFRNTGTATAPAFQAEVGGMGITPLGNIAYPSADMVDLDADGDLDAIVGVNSVALQYFANDAILALSPPPSITYTDTAFDDVFATSSVQLVGGGSDGLPVTFGILTGTDQGSFIGKATNYGSFAVDKTTGLATFLPNQAAIDSLFADLDVSVTVTVSDGLATATQVLTVRLLQAPGATESTGYDILDGTPGNDRFDALLGNDTVNGLGGDDEITGGPGFDLLLGGIGNDTLRGAENADTLIGGDGNDLLGGGKGVDSIDGGNGDDTLSGAAGGDTLIGGDGLDLVDYSAATDAVVVNLTIVGVPQLVSVLQSSDSLSGIERVRGSNLADTLTGDATNNQLFGLLGNDTLIGNEGFDTLEGGDGNDLLAGGNNADALAGGVGNDTLGGGKGVDSLDGGDGDDSLTGALGPDLLTGGSGADRFVFNSALDGVANIDTILDFASGTDQILLSAGIFGAFAGQIGQNIGLDARLQYNTTTGSLVYDADGVGLGAALAFATLGVLSHPAALGNDFLIIA